VNDDAWIAGVEPDFESEQLKIHIGWDARKIDPLGCSLMVRTEMDGVPLTTRLVGVTDLPPLDEGNLPSAGGLEPRNVTWSERLLTVTHARPRGTDWGVMLFSPSGELIDERPIARRYEQIRMALHANGSTEPTSVVVVGDRKDPPTAAESEGVLAGAAEVEVEARRAAARRRFSTAGEMEEYLRWRFSCVQGDLLMLDLHLLGHGDDRDRIFPFLERVDRSIRALTGNIDDDAHQRLSRYSHFEVRRLPHGRRTLHDRIWIVGKTGLLVGGSANTFLPPPTVEPGPATTIAELPHADAVVWREQFEQWWGHQ
jgi:hypothetical protein